MSTPPENPVFIEHRTPGSARTRVHVAVTEPQAWWARMWAQRPIYRDLYPPDNPGVALVAQPVPCMCGLLAHRPAIGDGRDAYVEEFDDELLCGSCRRAWIAAGGWEGALFEHPQPGVVELDEAELGEETSAP